LKNAPPNRCMKLTGHSSKGFAGLCRRDEERLELMNER
jgi:hypothetical protein